MNIHFGLLIFYYDIDFMFFLAVELKKKKKINNGNVKLCEMIVGLIP
jgi:hypothetical protein